MKGQKAPSPDSQGTVASPPDSASRRPVSAGRVPGGLARPAVQVSADKRQREGPVPKQQGGEESVQSQAAGPTCGPQRAVHFPGHGLGVVFKLHRAPEVSQLDQPRGGKEDIGT